tara:strand:- start:3054 stop:4781 length:1728 start_codon:yes stop_codon:yes gene_type:complete
MELTVTSNLQKSVLEPLYTQQNTVNSNAFKQAQENSLDTSKFYQSQSQDSYIDLDSEAITPFHEEVTQANLTNAKEVTQEFFTENLPSFLKNIPEDGMFGIFKGVENGVGNIGDSFPGLKPFIDEVAEMNLLKSKHMDVNLSLRDISKRVHQLDAERDKTFANSLTQYMFQAAPYLFLARSRLLQANVGIAQTNMLSWVFASAMGFKNEELLVSDMVNKGLSDTQFLSDLRKFDEKAKFVSLEGLMNTGLRGIDGYAFEKLFRGIQAVYRVHKVASMPYKERAKFLRGEREVKQTSEAFAERQGQNFPTRDQVKSAKLLEDSIQTGNPSEAQIAKIKEDPNVQQVIKDQQGKLTESTANKFKDPEFQSNRKFNFDGQEVMGYENAVNTYYKEGAANKDKIIHIFIGSPASGKSAKAEAVAAKFGSLIVDSDIFKAALPEFQGGSGAGALHEESKFLAERVIQMAKENGDNVVYPIIGQNEKKVVEAANSFFQEGYKVKLVYNKMPTNLSKAKNFKRGMITGRLVPEKYFDNDLDSQIKYVYDFVSPEMSGSATIKTGTIRKDAVIATEKKGIDVF